MATVVAARRRRFRNMQMRAQRVAIRAQQAPRRGRVVPPPKTWQERLDRAVDALVDGEEDALNEELLGRIESYASARRHSLAVQSALTRDPYRALGRLARPLAARVTVRSLERVRTRSESTVRAVLALRGTRSLSVVYEALDGDVRYSAALAPLDPSRSPKMILDYRRGRADPEGVRVRCTPGGCRALCRALGLPLDGEDVVFFLLSMLPTYDNEFELDDGVLGALGLLDGDSDSDDADAADKSADA